MSNLGQLPNGVPDFTSIEEERPRRFRLALGFLALALAAALLVAALTRVLSPGNVLWGSGILVGDGFVLTCEHVVRDATKITVHWQDRAYGAQVIASSPLRDLALLESKELEGEGVRWTRWRLLGPGDMVVAVGYPAGNAKPVPVVGEVLQVGGSAWLPSDARLDDLVFVHGGYEGGMSGAPLFNVWGEVMGVVSGSFEEGDGAGVGLAVSADTARRWLAAVAPQVTLQEGQLRARLDISQVADAAREVVVRLEVRPGVLDAHGRTP